MTLLGGLSQAIKDAEGMSKLRSWLAARGLTKSLSGGLSQANRSQPVRGLPPSLLTNASTGTAGPTADVYVCALFDMVSL